VLADAAVVDAADKFVCVRQNIEGQSALLAKYEIKGVPTIILTDFQGNEAGRLVGYKDKDAVVEKMIEANRGRSSFRESRRQALDRPEDAEANWRTAEIYLAEDRLQLAMRHLQNIVEHDPQNRRGYTANALFALGFAQGKSGQHREAAATLTRYFQEYPGHKDRERALFCLALSQLGLGQETEARQTLEKLVKEAPQSPVAPAAKKMLEKLHAKRNQ
jgi:TolA-binding protein